MWHPTPWWHLAIMQHRDQDQTLSMISLKITGVSTGGNESGQKDQMLPALCFKARLEHNDITQLSCVEIPSAGAEAGCGIQCRSFRTWLGAGRREIWETWHVTARRLIVCKCESLPRLARWDEEGGASGQDEHWMGGLSYLESMFPLGDLCMSHWKDEPRTLARCRQVFVGNFHVQVLEVVPGGLCLRGDIVHGPLSS